MAVDPDQLRETNRPTTAMLSVTASALLAATLLSSCKSVSEVTEEKEALPPEIVSAVDFCEANALNPVKARSSYQGRRIQSRFAVMAISPHGDGAELDLSCWRDDVFIDANFDADSNDTIARLTIPSIVLVDCLVTTVGRFPVMSGCTITGGVTKTGSLDEPAAARPLPSPSPPTREASVTPPSVINAQPVNADDRPPARKPTAAQPPPRTPPPSTPPTPPPSQGGAAAGAQTMFK